MKSQDIFILLKLVSLDRQAKVYEEDRESPSKAYIHGWEGWSLDDDRDKEKIFKTPDQPVLTEAYSNRGLEAASTGVSKSEVNASLKRSFGVGMAMLDRKTNLPKANISALLEFIVHGIKYVYPPHRLQHLC